MTLLSLSLTFELALSQQYISITRGNTPATSTRYVLKSRFATHKPLPWSSSDDVGQAVLSVLCDSNATFSATSGLREVSLVSDLISAHEARAQCSQIVYVTDKRITTKESKVTTLETPKTVRALVDYWLDHDVEVRRAMMAIDKERGKLPLTGWREFASERSECVKWASE